jgi:hypothetical protein
MSRQYANRTEITLSKNLNKEDRWCLQNIYDTQWHFDKEEVIDNRAILCGDCFLCNGESESEAHVRFTKAFREHFPDCGVETTWTYLRNLPSETYNTKPGEEIT